MVTSTTDTDKSLKNKLINDIALLVLLSYSLFVFNPFIVFMTDVVAHTFWEKEHLMTEHKANGKNHVELEITKADKQGEKDISKSNSKSEDFYHILIFNAVIDLSVYCMISQSFPLFKFHYPIAYPDIEYPPPRR